MHAHVPARLALLNALVAVMHTVHTAYGLCAQVLWLPHDLDFDTLAAALGAALADFPVLAGRWATSRLHTQNRL